MSFSGFMGQRPVRHVLIIGIVSLLLSAGAWAQYESPTRLFFSETFPDIQPKTDFYEIDNSVANDGLMNHFTVYAPSGTYFATGNELFLERLHELEVIPKLEQLKASQSYLDGVKAAGKSTVHSVKTLITQPVDTLSNVPKGVTRLFGNVVRGTKSERVTDTEDERYKQAIGFSKVKRQLAFELAVDPYSSNMTLQADLDDVAWAMFAGGMSLTVASALAVPAPINRGIGIGTTPARVAEVVRDESPQGIQKRVIERFTAAGVDQLTTEAFLQNEVISPTRRLIIADSLFALNGVEGLGQFVAFASQAASEEEARYMQRTAEVLAALHQRYEPLKKLHMAAERPIVETHQGKLLLAAPVDHAIWTPKLEETAKAVRAALPANFADKPVEIWITGDVTERAEAGLKELNVTVMKNAAEVLKEK